VGLNELAQLGEFVGGIVVVVSLVYLAYQVRQNTNTLRTENYARVLVRMSTLQSRIASDAQLNHIFVVGAEDPARLTRSERIRFSWALYELFGAGEFMYHQSRENALPDAVWKRWEATICWWLSHPGIRAWWSARPSPLASDFEDFAEEIIRTNRVDLQAVARWRGFVAGEGLPSPSAVTVAASELPDPAPGEHDP
jgi:hypothetical protein